MNLDTIRGSVRHFGLRHTGYDVVYRLLARAIHFKVLMGMTIHRVDPDFLESDARYRCLFLDPQRLRALGADPANELPPGFLDEALRKGDECFVILDGERLASYGWYATTPTALDLPALRLHFSTRYVYMYKGFTHPDYRGQRLHAIGMTRALASYLARGYDGLIAYVEANNFGSLKSVYRMGYTDIGRITLIRIAGRYLSRADRGCRPYGFRVESIVPGTPPEPRLQSS
jgi:acetyltransferase (GNAT) family protein